jgi:hypothetical protein
MIPDRRKASKTAIAVGRAEGLQRPAEWRLSVQVGLTCADPFVVFGRRPGEKFIPWSLNFFEKNDITQSEVDFNCPQNVRGCGYG